MPHPTKPRSSRQQEKLTVVFTSGQLVGGVCGLLIVALVCFLLGMVVDRFQISLQARQGYPTTAGEEQGRSTAPATSLRPQDQDRREGRQISPRVEPASPGPMTRQPERPSTPVPPGTREQGKQRVVELPPLKPPEERETAQEPAGDTIAPSDQAPKAPGVDTPAPAEELAPVSAQPSAQLAPLEPEEPTLPPKDEQAPETKPAKGAYAVQVATFSSGKRKEYAESCKRELEETTGLSAELITSDGGAYIRVLAGSYPDRKTAEKARDELRAQGRFTDCFVTRHH